MREIFHSELTELRQMLSYMCKQAAANMRLATEALLSADLGKANQALAADVELDELRDKCEARAQQMLALQAPVAGDLRLVLSVVYCADKIERMGDLAEHVAKTTVKVHPATLVPDELRDTFTRLGVITANMADGLVEHIASPHPGSFAELDRTDREVDDLHAAVLQEITEGPWPHGIPAATCLALVARFYERFADQAVSVAKRIEFVSTGKLPR